MRATPRPGLGSEAVLLLFNLRWDVLRKRCLRLSTTLSRSDSVIILDPASPIRRSLSTCFSSRSKGLYLLSHRLSHLPRAIIIGCLFSATQPDPFLSKHVNHPPQPANSLPTTFSPRYCPITSPKLPHKVLKQSPSPPTPRLSF